jgi:hypothetical protein
MSSIWANNKAVREALGIHTVNTFLEQNNNID